MRRANGAQAQLLLGLTLQTVSIAVHAQTSPFDTGANSLVDFATRGCVPRWSTWPSKSAEATPTAIPEGLPWSTLAGRSLVAGKQGRRGLSGCKSGRLPHSGRQPRSYALRYPLKPVCWIWKSAMADMTEGSVSIYSCLDALPAAVLKASLSTLALRSPASNICAAA